MKPVHDLNPFIRYDILKVTGKASNGTMFLTQEYSKSHELSLLGKHVSLIRKTLALVLWR